MSALTRVVIGASTLGGVAGGGYLLHRQLSTDNIEKKLTTNKYEILNEKSPEWENILTNYQATVRDSKNSHLKFEDFSGDSNGLEILKNKCKETLKKPSNNKEDYEKAKHWCTIPRTLANTLKAQGFKTLNTNAEDDKVDQAEWDKKLEAHAKDTSEIESKKFTDRNIPKTGKVQKEKANRDAIKTKCKELEGKNTMKATLIQT